MELERQTLAVRLLLRERAGESGVVGFQGHERKLRDAESLLSLIEIDLSLLEGDGELVYLALDANSFLVSGLELPLFLDDEVLDELKIRDRLTLSSLQLRDADTEDVDLLLG